MAEIRIEHEQKLPAQAAAFLAEQIRSAINGNGHCYCALSGGSSPVPLLQELAKADLPWQQVTFCMVDERFTSDTSKQNQTMLQEFIDALPLPGANLVTLLTNDSLAATVEQANEQAKSLPEALDLVVLGMGLDGHTASLFPDSTDYRNAMQDSARYVTVVPGEAPFPRISMSYRWLINAKQLVLYIPGPEKLNCFRKLLADPAAVSPIKSLAAHANNLIVFTSED
ncbi:MAG: 6-phosphogluconolactonase [Ketobacter sp.]|nr:MAG: 6-phosphogluconolactonase [Ketobacter sp.]